MPSAIGTKPSPVHSHSPFAIPKHTRSNRSPKSMNKFKCKYFPLSSRVPLNQDTKTRRDSWGKRIISTRYRGPLWGIEAPAAAPKHIKLLLKSVARPKQTTPSSIDSSTFEIESEFQGGTAHATQQPLITWIITSVYHNTRSGGMGVARFSITNFTQKRPLGFWNQ